MTRAALLTRAAGLLLALGYTAVCLGLVSPARDCADTCSPTGGREPLAAASVARTPATSPAAASDDASPATPDDPAGFGGVPGTPIALSHLAAAATFGLPSTGPSTLAQSITAGPCGTEAASSAPARTGDCWFATRGFLDATTTALRDRL